MQTATHTYLKVIPFSKLINWSSYTLLGKDLIYSQKYPFLRIGDFLKRSKEHVLVQDEVLYKRPTIRMNGNGISLRNEVIGKEIGTKNQFRIYKGQFLLSKIDARNGAFGVVPIELTMVIITGNFWTFNVDYNLINPHYLTLLTRTKEFQKLCQNASVGTTNRNYLQEKLFLNFEIPLPSIKEQGVLVNTFYEKINEAVSLAKQADSLERGIEKYIVKELGLSKKVEIEKNKGLHFVNFVDLNRWDTSFLFQKENENISKYPLVTYNNLFISLNNGMPARNYTENGTRFLKVADIKNNKIDNTNIKFIETCRATDFIEKDTITYNKKRDSR